MPELQLGVCEFEVIVLVFGVRVVHAKGSRTRTPCSTERVPSSHESCGPDDDDGRIHTFEVAAREQVVVVVGRMFSLFC